MKAACFGVGAYLALIGVYGLLHGISWLVPGIVVMMSCVSFGVYWWDKRKAQKNKWRTPEKTLHIISLLGGWPGALIAQWYIRHKNRKISFQAVFWLTVFLNVATTWYLFMPEWR